MSVVREFEAAFNRRDVNALVACFTPGATYHDTFYGPHGGHAALRAMFECSAKARTTGGPWTR